MNTAIQQMLDRYPCHSLNDYRNAIREIFQEIALLGLWRSKFFEHAVFYGGTCLRIFYGLDRFSEDIDFSLLRSNPRFDLKKYHAAVKAEFNSFGFDIEVEPRIKPATATIQSAFIKTGTYQNMIAIEVPQDISRVLHRNEVLKIKMEIDIDPPGSFSTEAKVIYQPIPFSVPVFSPSDLFAGKIHAVLCRRWKNRVKGRDWYDLVWYIGRGIHLNINHLLKRMVQSGHWQTSSSLTPSALLGLLEKKIQETDFDVAREDVSPFLKDPASITLWSQDFFMGLLRRLQVANKDSPGLRK